MSLPGIQETAFSSCLLPKDDMFLHAAVRAGNLIIGGALLQNQVGTRDLFLSCEVSYKRCSEIFLRF